MGSEETLGKAQSAQAREGKTLLRRNLLIFLWGLRAFARVSSSSAGEPFRCGRCLGGLFRCRLFGVDEWHGGFGREDAEGKRLLDVEQH